MCLAGLLGAEPYREVPLLGKDEAVVAIQIDTVLPARASLGCQASQDVHADFALLGDHQAALVAPRLKVRREGPGLERLRLQLLGRVRLEHDGHLTPRTELGAGTFQGTLKIVQR